MEDTMHGDSSLFDDDFDLDFDDEVAAGGTATATRTKPSKAAKALKVPKGRSGGYKPARMRTAPNWSRIGTALAVAAVVLVVIGLAVQGIRHHQKVAAYRAYFDDVKHIAAQSTAQGDELNGLLATPTGGDRSQLIARIDKLAGSSAKLEDQARKLSPPSAMTDADAWFVTTLEYRTNGLRGLEKALSTALRSSDRSAASLAVARANLRLQSSDVLYADSFQTAARKVLADQKVDGITVPDSVFATDPEFSSPKAMALMLGRVTAGSTAKGKAPTDGKVHGGQLTGVTATPSGKQLTASGLNVITLSGDLAFDVEYQNQGEGQETQIPVKVSLAGSGSEPLELTGTIESVDPGDTASVRIPLETVPDVGETMTMTVTIDGVPGEKKLDNNSATYQVQFKL
jgi:hypothetical protein